MGSEMCIRDRCRSTKNRISGLYFSSEWILGPTREYEQVGDVSAVVFPTGYVLDDDGDTLYIYYGAADSSICLATTSVRELLGWLKKHSYLGVI